MPRDVRLVRLAAGHRTEVAQPLVGRLEIRVEDEGGLVLDRPDAHPEPMEDRADPLCVALGQVVVDGDDMDPAADEPVEVRGERRDEGLALAGLHLGDRTAVEHDAAHELDVVVTLVQHPPHRLADRGERLGQDLLERLVDLLQLFVALPLQLVGEARGIGAGQRRLAGILVRVGLTQLDRDDEVAEPFAQPAAKLIGLRPSSSSEKAWSSGSSALMRSTIGSRARTSRSLESPNRDRNLNIGSRGV